MSSGPEIHPAQAKEYDPPSTPTGVMLLVGTAILIVIVFALEVLHAQYMSGEAAATDDRLASPAARLADEQVRLLEQGLVPPPVDAPAGTAPKKGKPIDAAMDEVVQRYGKQG